MARKRASDECYLRNCLSSSRIFLCGQSADIHACTGPYIKGEYVSTSKNITKVKLNWNLADGKPAIAYTGEPNVVALPPPPPVEETKVEPTPKVRSLTDLLVWVAARSRLRDHLTTLLTSSSLRQRNPLRT